MADFKKLLVWQKAQALAISSLAASRQIRDRHDISFRSQLVRAAFSIPANIAEGRSKQTAKEFARFLTIALNSSAELEYHLLTCRDIGLIRNSTIEPLIDQTIEVRRMLYGLIRRVTISD